MPEVVFFVASEGSRLDRYRMLCALAEQCVTVNRRVVIRTGDENELTHVDRLLWTYSDIAFLAHARIGTADAEAAAVLLTLSTQATGACECLINLAHPTPDAVDHCHYLVELIDHDETHKNSARHRYVKYKQSGSTPTTVHVSNYDEVRIQPSKN